MKRLTISMSDELFDKLEVIENKSLFIRKLIERELDILDNAPTDDIIPWTEKIAILRDDVNTIFDRLELIEKNCAGSYEFFENTTNIPGKNKIQESAQEITPIDAAILPEAENIEETVEITPISNIEDTEIVLQQEQEIVAQDNMEQPETQLPVNETIEQELLPPVQKTTDPVTEEQELVTPIQISVEEPEHEIKLSEMVADRINKPEIKETELTAPEQAEQDNGFTMPELKPPEQVEQDNGFTMPELKPPEQVEQDTGFVMLELKPPEQANQDNGFTMPELKPPEQANQNDGFVMLELKPPEQAEQDNGFTMPELKPPEQANQDNGFTMPKLKPPEQANQDNGFTMPELKPPEQANQDNGFTMPELKPPEQAEQDAGFVMPDFNQSIENQQVSVPPASDVKPPANMQVFNQEETQNAQELPSFKVPEMQQSGGLETLPPFGAEAGSMPEMQNTPAQQSLSAPSLAENQNIGAKQDKLEGNILMYMPRGAKVKKEIIKSLVSRQFSQEEIDRKIQELLAREVLVLKQENGIEHLHRLK